MNSQDFRDPDAEQFVVRTLWQELSSMPSEGTRIFTRANLLASDFTTPEGAEAVALLAAAARLSRAPTLRGVSAELREYLDTNELLNPGELDEQCENVRAMATKRALKASLSRVWREVQGGKLSPEELLALYAQEARDIPARSDGIETLEGTVTSIQREINLPKAQKRSRVLTGFEKFDARIEGLHSTLVVLAGMPGCGKSAVEAAIVRHMALRGEPSLVFCMEDDSRWMGYRYLAEDSGVRQGVLRHRELDGAEQNAVGEGVAKLSVYQGKVFVCNRQGMRPAEVIATARAAIWKYRVRAIWLDNMTAMRFRSGDRRDLEVQDFLVDARDLAVSHSVPFVCLSHIGKREGLDQFQMPRLTDCRESTAFSNLCRQGIVVWRRKDDSDVNICAVKNTNGEANVSFTLGLSLTSAIVNREIEQAELDERAREKKLKEAEARKKAETKQPKLKAVQKTLGVTDAAE